MNRLALYSVLRPPSSVLGVACSLLLALSCSAQDLLTTPEGLALLAPAGGGGGGPDAYYFGTSGTNSATLIGYWFGGVIVGDNVTATAAGSVTKIGCKVAETSATSKSMSISLWKYSGGNWVLHECKDFTLAASWGPAWTNVTLTTAYTIGASETVRVVYTCSDTGGNVGWYGGTGVDSYRDSLSWANRCNQPGWTADEQAGACIYVD